jgi:signal transduction histidine kinase
VWSSQRVGDLGVVSLTIAGAVEFTLLGAPGLAPAAVAWTLPLWGRRVAPLVAPLTSIGLHCLVMVFAPAAPIAGTPFVVLATACWLLGLHNTPRRALPAVVAAAALTVPALAPPTLGLGVDTLLLMGTPAAAGAVVARNRRVAALLGTVVDDLHRSRPETLHAAAADERARIARELHDLVTSNVSAMTLQAGAARLLLDIDPQRAREPIGAVQEAGRDALTELRRLLEVLGATNGVSGQAPATPQPGLQAVPALLDRANRAGLQVRFEEVGERRRLADGVELAVYRILQEALHNVLKHTGPTRVSAVLRHEPGVLELEVHNDGPTGSTTAEDGHGLTGMRERVALYGGDLLAGPVLDGYRVRARIPTAP